MSDEIAAKIVGGICLCLFALPVWIAGAAYGRYCLQCEAISAGVAEWTADEKGVATFRFKEPTE